MKCPFCQHSDDKVIDSRVVREGEAIRRRRECTSCAGRYTTYEYVESITRTVVKKDGSREDFDRQKLLKGIKMACSKRPISYEMIENSVDSIINTLSTDQQKEVTGERIGELVMSVLKDLDDVAYVRFASVYRKFEVKEDFVKEIQEIKNSDH